MTRWFACVTNPNCLNRAEGKLAQLGYRTFTPRLRKWVSHARQKRAVWRPILGRYLFVEVDPSRLLKLSQTEELRYELASLEMPKQSFLNVRSCNGVEGLVGIAGEPQALPTGVVEELMRRQMSGEWDEVARGPLPVGARVRIMDGEFADMLATLIGTKRGRCAVKLLGTSVVRNLYPVNLRPAA